MDLCTAKEKREARDLATYAMRSALTKGRKYPETADSFRTVYERDRDRIIHSAAFRRLEYKTQVFLNEEGDYYRTRLTHSLEVSQVARSLAGALSLNEPLTEAIALAHDLGHPPFGHSGEDTLHQLMQGQGGFKHNLQVLRIVDILEERSPAYRGLNLSYEVRESLLKAEKTAPSIADEFTPTKYYLLEEQVVDLADSTAYNHHDLDDGLKSEILTEQQLNNLQLWKRARKDAEQNYPGLAGKLRLRRILNSLLGLCIHDLIEESLRRIEEYNIKTVDEVRNGPGPIVGHSAMLGGEVQELQKFLYQNFYRHPHINQMMTKARQILSELFHFYIEHPQKLPQEWQAWCEKTGLHRGLCDYISGMTDRYAKDEHQRLFGS